MDELEVMPVEVSDEDAARKVLTVQRAAYAIEAELIGYPDLPMLHETLDELRASKESFLGAHMGGRLVGVVSWDVLEDGTVDVFRLVVDPAVHRRGVASLLLESLAAWEPTTRTIVSTGSANAPALALYARHGFVRVAEREVAPGVRLTDLERREVF